MRCFWLERLEDVSGSSGTGFVAEGVEFSGGKCAIRWMTAVTSIAVYDSLADLEAIHGNNGKTKVVWRGPQGPATFSRRETEHGMEGL